MKAKSAPLPVVVIHCGPEPSGGYGIDVAVPANLWLALRVEFKGNRFRVLYNRKQLFEVEDSTFGDAGKVGLWTKADSVTLFDEIAYGEAK